MPKPRPIVMSYVTPQSPMPDGTEELKTAIAALHAHIRELDDELAAANKVIVAARRYCAGSHPYPQPPKLSAALAEYDARTGALNQ